MEVLPPTIMREDIITSTLWHLVQSVAHCTIVNILPPYWIRMMLEFEVAMVVATIDIEEEDITTMNAV